MNFALRAVLGLIAIFGVFQATFVECHADFTQDFSSNANSWHCSGCEPLVTKTIGTNGVLFVPPVCSSEFNSSCPFGTPAVITTWNTNSTFSSETWVRGGFEASIKVWLDPLDPAIINTNGVQLEWAVAANDNLGAGDPGRFYVLAVGKYDTSAVCRLWPNCLVFGTTAVDDLSSASDSIDPTTTSFPQEAGETGWYTFKHTFIETNKYLFPVNDTLNVQIEVITPSGRRIAPPQWVFNTELWTGIEIGDVSRGYFVLNLDPDGIVVDDQELTYPTTCVPCDDDWECTYDYFEPRHTPACPTKCLNIPLDSRCDDSDPCTTDWCDPLMPYLQVDANGCAHQPIDCDDGNACTDDICTGGNCTNIPVDCDDSIDCTIDACEEDVIGGCVNVVDDTLCVPTDECHVGVCDLASGGCVFVEALCDDNIYCTENLCNDTTGCVFKPRDDWCDDGIPCTEDVCDVSLGRCTNIPRDSLCPNADSDYCTLEYCSVSDGGCLTRPKICEDHIACTDDQCHNGTCVYVPIHAACDDGVACTVDTCDVSEGQCTNLQNDTYCEDGDLCTENICDPVNGHSGSGCLVASTKNCTYEGFDEKACTIEQCVPQTGLCAVVSTLSCNDGIACTVDSCDTATKRCKNLPKDSLCPVVDKCNTYACEPGYPGGCRPTPIVCDDDVSCTANLCVAGKCTFPANNTKCNDGIDCTDDTCSLFSHDPNSGGCTNIPNHAHCNDGVGCTLDYCVPSLGTKNSCTHTPVDEFCDDNNECTLDRCSYDPDTHTYSCTHHIEHALCDDGIFCTLDVCDANLGCIHYAYDSWCDDMVDCTVDQCKPDFPHFGCAYTAKDSWCDDGVDCTEDVCDLDTGCSNTGRNEWCDDNLGCTIDVCNSTTGCENTPDHDLCDDGRDCTVPYCDVEKGECTLSDEACPEVVDEHCINCKSSKSRIEKIGYDDGSVDMELKTRSIYALPNTVATKDGLETNIVLKSSGHVLIGVSEEDAFGLSEQDDLIVQAFRLSPSATRPLCTETRRGTMTVVPVEGEDEDKYSDRLFVCVRTVLGYEWKLVDLSL